MKIFYFSFILDSDIFFYYESLKFFILKSEYKSVNLSFDD